MVRGRAQQQLALLVDLASARQRRKEFRGYRTICKIENRRLEHHIRKLGATPNRNLRTHAKWRTIFVAEQRALLSLRERELAEEVVDRLLLELQHASAFIYFLKFGNYANLYFFKSIKLN